MKRALFSGVFQIVIFFIMILLPSLAFAEVVGYFSKIEGRVDILRVGADTAVSVRIGDPVSMGDIVRTKSDGKAEIIFKDETSVRLAPDTRVRIDEYTFNPDNTRNKGILNLFRGKIRAVVSKVVGRVIPAGIGASTFNVNTPTAIAGVRGTTLFVFYSGGITGVLFTDGNGFAYNPNLPGLIVNVGTGQITFVAGSDAPPSPPRTATGAELAVYTSDTAIGEGAGGETAGGELLAGGETPGDIISTPELDLIPVTDYDSSLLASDYTWSWDNTTSSYSINNGQFDSGEECYGSISGGTDFSGAGYYDSTSGQGIWAIISDGTYGLYGYYDPSDTWYFSSQYYGTTTSGDSFIFGTHTEGILWSSDILAGTTFAYGANSPLSSSLAPFTWISVGATIGTFDANALTWQAIQAGIMLETNKFLAMTQTTEGQATLNNLSIPFAEVGRTDLRGSGNNLTVNMNNVIFFAYSSGLAPKIWATGDVNGTYTAAPNIGTAVSLAGSGLNADFTVRNWTGGNWASTVNGSGTLSGGSYNGTVNFQGAAAGTYGSGSLSGTGAGVVVPAVP